MDKIPTVPQTLALLKPFETISPTGLEKIARYCQTCQYAAGETIIRFGDEGTDVFFLFAGQVKASVYSTPDRSITLQTLSPGMCFGEIAAIDRKPRSAYVIATADSVVISIKADRFLDIIRHHPTLALNVINRLCGMVRELSLKTFMRNNLSAGSRICVELLRLASQEQTHDNRVRFSRSYTQKELAAAAVTSRESVSRKISELKKQGIIVVVKSRIEIVDIVRLANMLD
jgi:CRP-like cAMP-binding protein